MQESEKNEITYCESVFSGIREGLLKKQLEINFCSQPDFFEKWLKITKKGILSDTLFLSMRTNIFAKETTQTNPIV